MNTLETIEMSRRRRRTQDRPILPPDFDQNRDPPRIADGLAGGLVRQEWEDPEDRNDRSGLRAGSKVRQVSGYRRWDVRSSLGLVRHQQDAAERYIEDAELTQGGLVPPLGERMAGSPAWLRVPAQVKLDAEERMRQARHAIGVFGTGCLDMVLLENCPVRAWAAVKLVGKDARGDPVLLSEHQAKGMLVAFLQRLAEHYGMV